MEILVLTLPLRGARALDHSKNKQGECRADSALTNVTAMNVTTK
jgi:hypothetical protein